MCHAKRFLLILPTFIMSSLAIVIIPALLFTKLYPSWSRNLEYEFENKLLNLQHLKFKHSTKQWINLYQYITQLVITDVYIRLQSADICQFSTATYASRLEKKPSITP